MACCNWKGKATVHFYLPTSCDMPLLIRASDAFELVEYFIKLNSILNKVLANFYTFLFKLAWIK